MTLILVGDLYIFAVPKIEINQNYKKMKRYVKYQKASLERERESVGKVSDQLPLLDVIASSRLLVKFR